MSFAPNLSSKKAWEHVFSLSRTDENSEFQDEITSDIDDTLTSETTQMHSSRLSPVIPLSSVPPLRTLRRSFSDTTADDDEEDDRTISDSQH